MSSVNEAVPVCAPKLLVAITVVNNESAPYAKPLLVASWPPVAVIIPLNVTVVCPIDEAASVVTVGRQALVVKFNIDPVLVPAEFTT